MAPIEQRFRSALSCGTRLQGITWLALSLTAVQAAAHHANSAYGREVNVRSAPD